MACFLVPGGEAVVATIVTKIIEKKENQVLTVKSGEKLETPEKLPFSRKLKWLTNLLWGGAALLAYEHVWHGEVEPWFPFLTAAGNPEDAAEMLHEMGTAGVGMALLITLIWVGMLGVAKVIEKRPETPRLKAK